MTTRRTEALDLVRRLEEQKMEAVARRLHELTAGLRRLDDDIARLRKELADATLVTKIEAAPHVGGYIRAMRAEITARETARAELAGRVRTVEAEILTGFRRTRTLEISGQSIEARAAKRRASALETAALERMNQQFGRDSGPGA